MQAPSPLFTPFRDWLGTNYAPSSDEVSLIKSFLHEPLNTLAALEIQIKDLRDEIEAHRALCHPIRQLPDDLLVEIFSYTLPIDHFPAMSSRESPMVLVHVCQRWRDIVLSTPSLWSSLHIAVPPQLIGEGGSDDAWVAVLERRAACLKWWLDNTGTSQPLGVSLYWPKNINPDDSDLSLEDYSVNADDQRYRIPLLLTGHLHRITELVLQVPNDVSQHLFVDTAANQFPSLERFTMHIDDVNYPASWHMSTWRAPKLKKMVWAGANATAWLFYLADLRWDVLQEISIRTFIHPSSALNILASTPYIAQLSIMVNGAPVQDESHAGMDFIVLRYLKTFCLLECVPTTPYPAPQRPFLQNFRIPALQNFSYRLCRRSLSPGDLGDSHPLVQFLESHIDYHYLPSLKRLKIGSSSISPASLVTALGMMSSLRYLWLFREEIVKSRYSDCQPVPVVWDDQFLLAFKSPSTSTNLRKASSEGSKIGRPMKSNDTSGSGSSPSLPALCPSLQNLRVDESNFTLPALRDFVEGRLAPGIECSGSNMTAVQGRRPDSDEGELLSSFRRLSVCLDSPTRREHSQNSPALNLERELGAMGVQTRITFTGVKDYMEGLCNPRNRMKMRVDSEHAFWTARCEQDIIN